MFAKPKTLKPSTKRQKRNKAYSEARETYLDKHFWCEVCKDEIAIEVHHKQGRLGKLLTDQENFLAVCKPCHYKIEHNRTWAYEQGFLVKRNSND